MFPSTRPVTSNTFTRATLLFGATTLFLAVPALAQTRSQVYGTSLTQQTQTVSATADVGMYTYQSQAAGSTESRIASTYTLSGWAGEDRVIGASITASDADVPFALNSSKMRTSFRDVRMKARLGWLIPSVGASLSEVDVDKNGAQAVGLYGTGLNAGLTLAVPVASVMVLSADGLVVQSSQIYDKLNQGMKLGQRENADLSAAYHVVERFVDVLVGYRMQQYTIQASNATDKEVCEGAYAGVRLGVFF